MDSQAGERLVAPSNFHTEWSKRVLVRINSQFLAGRIYLAWQTTHFPSDRCILRDLFHARDRLGRNQSVSALNEIDRSSARESLAGVFEFRCPHLVRCPSINGLRLRVLRVSVARASVLYLRKIALCRRGSVFSRLCLGTGLDDTPPARNLVSAHRNRRNRDRLNDSTDTSQLASVFQPLQFFPYGWIHHHLIWIRGLHACHGRGTQI